MAQKKWTGEGAAVGVDLTALNQGSSDVLTITKTSASDTFRATNTAGQVLVGTQSGRVHTVAGEIAYGAYIESGTVTQKSFKGRYNFPTAPSVDILIGTIQAASGTAWGIQLRTTGRLAIVNANASTTIYVTPTGNAGALSGNSAVPFPTGDFTVDGWVDIGTNGSLNTGDGSTHVDIYRHAVSSSTPWQTSGDMTGQNFASKGTSITQERIGCMTGAASDFSFDDFSVLDGKFLQGTYENPTATPPTITTPASTQILTGTKPTITMGLVDPSGTNTPSWVAVSAPAGVTVPTVAYPSGDHTTMTTAANITSPGEYVFKPMAGTYEGTPYTLYVANADGTSIVMSSSGPFTGTVADVNDSNTATYNESPSNPNHAIQRYNMSPKAAGSAVRINPEGYRFPSDGVPMHNIITVVAGATDTVIKTIEYDPATTVETPSGDLTSGELANFSAAGGYNKWAILVDTDQV